MTEETKTPQAGENGSETGTPAGNAGQGGQQTFDADYVAKLRQENADRRVRNNELASELAELRKRVEALGTVETTAKTLQDQMAAIQKELQTAQKAQREAELGRLRMVAAAKVGLPDALIGRIKGETPEEIEADAAELAKVMPRPAATPGIFSVTNPAGGSGPRRSEQILKKMGGGEPPKNVFRGGE